MIKNMFEVFEMFKKFFWFVMVVDMVVIRDVVKVNVVEELMI